MYLSHETASFNILPAMPCEAPQGPVHQGKAMRTAPAHVASWQAEVIRLLKTSLIKELVCVIRYNHLSGNSPVQPLLSAEFLLHAYDELAFAHKLARRIETLGGELVYSPELLMRIGRATHDYHRDLKSMIAANLISEYRTIIKYTEIISQIDPADVSGRSLLEEIVSEERAHAEELCTWLVN